MADTSDLRRDRRHLLLFLGVTFTVSLAIEIAILRAGGLEAAGALPVLALMWTPGLVALAMRARLRDLPDAGFRLGRPRFLLTAYLLPVGVGALAYGAAWVTHLAPFRVPDAWAARGVPLNILLRVSVGVVVGSIFALGEEIGWRGLMVPLLVRVRAPAPLVLSGIIWGLWHTPLILFGDYATSGHPAVSALLFMLAIAGAAVSFGWLRLASASVWPAMLIHASHNAWFQSVFDSLTAHSATWGWPRGCWRRGACGPFPRRCSGGSLRGRRVLL